MNSRWRTAPWSGAAIGFVAAVVLAWLLREGQQALRASSRSVDPAQSEATLVGAFWLLFALGAVLVVVMFAARFHPLIPAVPGAWFFVVFGPALLGVMGTPDWYPEWLRSYFLQTAGEAGPLVTGVLVTATAAGWVLRRPSTPEPVGTEVEEAGI
jgi:hypothetical protein